MNEIQEIYAKLNYIEDRLKDWHISWTETQKLLTYQHSLREKLEALK